MIIKTKKPLPKPGSRAAQPPRLRIFREPPDRGNGDEKWGTDLNCALLDNQPIFA